MRSVKLHCSVYDKTWYAVLYWPSFLNWVFINHHRTCTAMNIHGPLQSFISAISPGAGRIRSILGSKGRSLTLNRPSSYIIVRLPIGKYLAVSVYVLPPKPRISTDNVRFLWGGIMMCHAACSNWAGLMTVRFFLGVGEAAIAPGFTLIIGMFYRREEQPLR